MTSPYKVGQTIRLNDGRTATVQFVGQTSFSTGDWVGVVFDEPLGKNDGSVQGQRYFDCNPGHGMFLRPTGIEEILEQPTPKPAKPKTTAPGAKAPAAAGALKSRPGMVPNGVRRAGSIDTTAAKRQSINAASPTPGARGTTAANGTRSPLKPASRAIGSSTTSNASSRGVTPTTARPTSTKPTASSRLSVSNASTRPPSSASSSTRPTRPSVASSAATRGGRVAPSTTSTRPTPSTSSVTRTARSTAPTTRFASGTSRPSKDSSQDSQIGSPDTEATQATENTTLDHQSLDESEEEPEKPNGDFAPPAAPVPAPAPAPEGSPSPTKEAQATQRGATSARQIQDLETKLKHMEQKRDEDREKLKSLERLQSERDRFENIIQKLQTKLQPQQAELAELRKKVKDAQEKYEEVEALKAEHESSLEMATLDREMAEEQAEVFKTELDALKQKAEELELEVEVLRDENHELGTDVGEEERGSVGWLQLERKNERLTEALLRLRDATQAQEAELKDQISSLEEDLKELDGVKQQYEEAQEKLKLSEAAVDNLKQQLDNALGAEEMLEELTEKNLSLNEHIEELKLNIEDLENLKELNDELELNHVEAENQLQEELYYKDSVIYEQNQRVTQQEERLTDYEYTINKFRDLVSNLESHLKDMQASQQLTEAEADELNSRSKAMTDLNMKLQSSAAKTQMNAIDLEMRKVEAQEAIEHLAIVQMFLLESYTSERDSVNAYLRFRRIAAKSRVLHSTLKSKVNNHNMSTPSDTLFVTCEVLDKLTWIATMCDRFVSHISGCSLERFSKYEGALYELDPVERALNGYIELLKRDELREQTVAEELQRSSALLTHLAEVHIVQDEDNLADYAEHVLMRTLLVQNYLETTATAMTFTNALISRNDGEEEQEHEDEDSIARFVEGSSTFISNTRSAKVVAGRDIQSLEDLKARSMSVNANTGQTFEDCEAAAEALASWTRQLGEYIRGARNEDIDGDVDVRTKIRTALSTFCANKLPDTTSSDPLALFSTKLRSVSNGLNQIHDLATNLPNTVEFTRNDPPWIQRSAEFKASKEVSHNIEAELARLKDSVSAHAQQLRSRDQTLEEANVKIELLESRTRDANAKANRITELTRAVEAGKSREKELAVAIEKQSRDAYALQDERDRWKQLAEERKARAHGADDGDDEDRASTDAGTKRAPGERAVATAREMDALRTELVALKSAVRFLRDDNRRARLAAPDDPYMQWLAHPLLPRKAAAPAHALRDTLAREGRDVLASLIDVIVAAPPLDLAPLATGPDRLRWRPAREKSSWVHRRHAEQWESWRARRDGFIRRGEDVARAPLPALEEALPRVEREDMGLPERFEDAPEAIGIAA